MLNYGRTIHVRNVNEALPIALMLLRQAGVPSESRGLKTVRLPGPLMTVYSNPEERVLFGETRDANPFFHLMDALWMLSGSNRVDLPALFLPRIKQYSDDGVSFHGSYGYRLRYLNGFDQINRACDILAKKPDSRQVVLTIWDPRLDLGATTKDVPCNDMVMVDIVDGAVCITVCCRSNDAVWGAYGANAVQFSMLQEYIAARLELRVGYYVQMSNNLHVYDDNAYWQKYMQGEYDHTHIHNPYMAGVVMHPLATDAKDAALLFRDCVFLAHHVEVQGPDDMDVVPYESFYFATVVVPVLRAWKRRLAGDLDGALRHIENVQAWDWRTAMQSWIKRRIDNQGATK